MKVRIESDVFGISDRLKSADSGYFVVFDTRREKYEVHNSKNRGGDTYCLTVPYKNLDSRTVGLVLKTRSERIKELLAEIEKNNKAIGAE